MSVNLINENEVSQISKTLSESKEVQNLVSKMEFFARRNEGAKESAETFIGRSIWYGYIANITAYNVQYRENVSINFEIESAKEEISLEQAVTYLNSLYYNIYTNDGNSFLAKEWADVIDVICKMFK